MTDTYVTIDDRRFLRAVAGGRILLAADGRIMQRGSHRNGRREKTLRRAVAAGWVHEQPDPTTALFSLTTEGEQALAAREPETHTTGGER